MVTEMAAATQDIDCNLDERRQARPIPLTAVSTALRLFDVLIISGMGAATYLAYAAWRLSAADGAYIGPILAGVVIAMIAFQAAGVYAEDAILARGVKLHRVFLGWLITACVLLMIAFAFKITASYSRIWAVSWVGLSFAGLAVGRFLLDRQIRALAERGRFARRAVIVGAGEQGARLAAHIRETGCSRTDPIGFIDDRKDRVPARVAGYPLLGGSSDLVRLIQSGQVDEVILALPWSAEERLLAIVETLSETPVRIRLGPDLIGFNFPDRKTSHVAKLPVLGLFERPISGWPHAAKTLLDTGLAAAALVFLGPLMLLIAASIKLDSPGPVLFRQKRYGFNQSIIEVLKFRTMRANADGQDGSRQCVKDDPRITRVGRFLRKSSLDELPQLINVLRGEMAVVGPRPHPVGLSSRGRRFEEVVNRYAARHKVKPGITGWAQVNGWRGETDTVEKIRQRVEHDLFYIDNWSVWLDLAIIWRTVRVIWDDQKAY